MQLPNPMLQRLGFAPNDRAVILHLDDVGMSHASVQAYADLLDFGLMSSAAVMVTCPWFPAAAAVINAHPQADVGVHLTLTSEWDAFRWGPISTRDAASGLMDTEGYFHRSAQAARAQGDVSAAAAELLAQAQRAAEAGIDITHMDSHMGTLLHSKYLGLYARTAQQYRVPAMLLRFDAEQMLATGMDEAGVSAALALVAQHEAQGVPLLDDIVMMPLDEAFGEERLALAMQYLGALKPGITHFLFHAAVDTPELRAHAPDWPARVGDWRVFTSPALRDFIRQQGIQVIGYRLLRDALRSA